MSKQRTKKYSRSFQDEERIDFEDRRNHIRSKRKIEKQYLRDMLSTDGSVDDEVLEDFDEFEDNVW